jgi:hypothetical protein
MKKTIDVSSDFREDPWEGIQAGTYPEARRLYRENEKFWVSKNRLGEHIFFVQDECELDLSPIKDLHGAVFNIERINSKILRFRCTLTIDNDHLKANFSAVCKQIATACIDLSGYGLFRKVMLHINIWAKFLKPSKSGLTTSEMVGFWGELFALNNVLGQILSLEDAVQAWVGPEGKKNDFICYNKGIEVKTTLAGNPKTIAISSLDQLDASENRIFLLHIHAAVSKLDASESIKTLYEKISSGLSESPKLESEFHLKAFELYNKATEDQKMVCFQAGRTSLFDVAERFPRITRQDVPVGISDARYSIYISSLAEFEVTNNMHEAITSE